MFLSIDQLEHCKQYCTVQHRVDGLSRARKTGTNCTCSRRLRSLCHERSRIDNFPSKFCLRVQETVNILVFPCLDVFDVLMF